MRTSLPFLMFIPFTVVFPGFIIFLANFTGQTPDEAFHHGIKSIFSLNPGAFAWGAMLVVNVLILGYLKPVAALYTCFRCGREADPDLARKVIRRLNHFSVYTIVVVVLCLVVSGIAEQQVNIADHVFSIQRVFSVLDSASTGLLIAVFLFLNIENLLFPAKQLALKLAPSEGRKSSSMFRRIFIFTFALLVFVIFQIFASSGDFFRLGLQNIPGVEDLKIQAVDKGSGAFGLLNSEMDKVSGLKDSLLVLLVRIGGYLILLGQLMMQLKLMIRKPLAIIHDRLNSLNSDDPKASREVEIVNNDEFAQVFRQINRLVRRQQGELVESVGKLSSIMQNAADPIIVYNAHRRIDAFNPAAERYFGYTAAEVLGKDVADVLKMCDETGRCFDSKDEFLLKNSDGSAVRSRFESRSKSGAVLKCEAHVSCSEGDIYTVIVRDISAQLEIETNLRNAKTAAENANHMKSEFLANMSHELRTPLNAVLGFTQLLLGDKNLTDEQRGKIETVSRSGEHLLELINDILDISKIEAGKIELHETIFDLPQFVQDIHDMFELRCKKKGLSLYVEHVSEFPRFVVGDLGKLRQIVINLVGNAVKFTSEGGIGIAVGTDAGQIRFSVTDSGKGIPPGELDLILQPFAQSSITDNEGGTGLGLAISSRFIEMMGGKLEIQSKLGEGSVFTFAVDLPESSEAPVQEAEELRPVAVKQGHEVKVLIVDDKVTNRLVLKEMLERVGFITLEAENGREAVERALEFGPSIVFMDIKMPTMDGYAAVRELKATDEGKKMKIFALTASAFKHDEQKIADAGFDGFLAKPFKQSSLFALIRTKTATELVYEEAAQDKPVHVNIDSVDFAAVRAAMSASERAQLADAVAINDFASVRNFADGIQTRFPQLAALLRGYASSFEDEGLNAVLGRLGV